MRPRARFSLPSGRRGVLFGGMRESCFIGEARNIYNAAALRSLRGSGTREL